MKNEGIFRLTFNQNVTAIEDSRRYCNHVQCGAILAMAWGMSETIVTAIRYHQETLCLRSNLEFNCYG
jgi:HD-like signal output (HDOD) protein